MPAGPAASLPPRSTQNAIPRRHVIAATSPTASAAYNVAMLRNLVVLLALAASAAGAQTPVTAVAPPAPQPMQQPAPQPAPPTTPAGVAIEQYVAASRLPELRWPDFSDYRKHLERFYADNAKWQPAWIAVQPRGGYRVTPQARAVALLFAQADAKGINAADYDGAKWPMWFAAAERSPSPDAAARFDVAFTATLMRYISDLHIGRVNPRNLHVDLDIEAKKYYLPDKVLAIATASDPASLLATVEPPYDEYRRLQNALVTYRRMATEAATEGPLPVVKVLKAGDTYAAMPQLVRMLRRFGDLAPNAAVDAKSTTYAEPVVAAVKRFQIRHGLGGDGIISARTFNALNVPLTLRARQIQWALERWRWMPTDLTSPPIVVNIPEFALRAWDDTRGHSAMTMPVVVGKAYTHETPVFVGQMKYLVFRPYWNVPGSIQAKELVPKVAKDRAYLARNGYEVVRDDDSPVGTSNVDDATLAALRSGALSIRQKPGPSNALGLVKFMFPNHNNVYLHSTPSQELFSRTRRDFSHGCIRVERPADLATFVLREQAEWTPQRIAAAMKGNDPTQVNLKKPIPVIIFYATATVTDSGEVHFYDDVYDEDATLENALEAGYPYPA